MSITWLHISDFHIRGGDPYDRDVVLRALVASVADYRATGRAPDLIFATGDIAHAGKEIEYTIATKFFDELLTATGLDKSRLFVIPGNHDVDRDMAVGLARTLDSREQSDRYFRPELPKLHLTQKLRAYLDWHKSYFAGIRTTPENSTCFVQEIRVQDRRLAILLMNSALFCEGDDDHEKLWIGRRCLDAAIEELRKVKADVNIGLIHHPLEWLSPTESSNIRADLEANAHILLRGHLHETRLETVASAEGQIFHCAAGATYQTTKWPNRALYATLDGNRVTVFPIRYEDSPQEIWTVDPSVFPKDRNFERIFPLRGSSEQATTPRPQETAPPPRFRSNIPSRGTRPFAGRADLLQKILDTFDDTAQERVLIIQGQPGVGKSDLAKEYARLHKDRYTGGTFLVDASKEAIAFDLARIGKNILEMDLPADLPLADQGQQTFYGLASAPTLLIYDNVVSFESTMPWLPPSGMPCHVLITTLVDSANPHWPRIEVLPLSLKEAEGLVMELGGGAISVGDSQMIAKRGGGLPVQIVPDAVSFASAQRRGRPKSEEPVLAREATASFQAVYNRLPQPARLLLHAGAFLNPQRIPFGELSLHMGAGLNWNDAEIGRALDNCLDLHLLEGSPDPAMHQLFARFVRQNAPPEEDRPLLSKVRDAQRQRFVELAGILSHNPSDAESATKLLSYPLDPATWLALSPPLSLDEFGRIGQALYEIGRFDEAKEWFLHQVSRYEQPDANGAIDHQELGRCLNRVGYCLSSNGQYEEARPWFEKAIAESNKGGVDGNVDHRWLGASLHQVGASLSNKGLYEEARTWYQKAVSEHLRGDTAGRIDHRWLGSSLHQIGVCLSGAGKYKEARPWYEQAVKEKEKGDVNGRVDHEQVARSVHQVGYCISSLGDYKEALTWYQRAVAEHEKGDIHSRINHGQVGNSLHQVGLCLLNLNRHEEARAAYQRAVEESERGDVFGRITTSNLAMCYRSLAECLRRLGLTAEAAECERKASDTGAPAGALAKSPD